MRRAALALIASLCLTAFAPAPWPRPRRDRERHAIDMKIFQGTWAVISMEIVQGNGQPHQKLTDWGEDSQAGTVGVRVKGDVFTYLHPKNDGGSYRVDIDPTARPAAIDWYTDLKKADGQKPGMLGLVRREGDKLVILYYATSPERRPRTFDSPPSGWWILTLRRK